MNKVVKSTHSLLIHPMKKPVKQRFSKLLIYIGIIIFAFFLRSIFIHLSPSGISDDELEFILNAKSIFYTGHSLDNIWSPFDASRNLNIFPPLPYVFVAPFMGILPLNLFTARLPYILASIILVVITASLSAKLFNNKTGLLTLIVGSISPWGIFFGRTAFESPVATLFLLTGVRLFLESSVIPIISSVFFFTSAFYFYTGIKPIIAPIIVLLTIFTWKNSRNHLASLSVCFITILLLTFQLITLKNEAIGSRIQELITPYSPLITESVIKDRRLTINNPFIPFVSNRITSYTTVLVERYGKIFSPQFLFLNGEGRSTYSLYKQGYLYIIDAFFILAGLLALSKRSKKAGLLLGFMIIISSIPAIINGQETSFGALRAATIFPLFWIIVAFGITTFTDTLDHWTIKPLIAVLYSISLLNFIYIYLFQYPIYSSEGYGFSSRELSRYIQLNAAKKTIVVLDNPKRVYRDYLFYTDTLTRTNVTSIQNNESKNIYDVGNASFVSCDSPHINEYLHSTDNTVIFASDICHHTMMMADSHYLSISQLSDGGEIYKIHNDDICNSYTLNKYPKDINLNSLNVASLTKEQFCTTFISDLHQ